MMPLVQLDEMFCQGCAYADCADMLEVVSNEFFLEYASAQITNSAFSAEIFLKVLLERLGKKAKNNHKLQELFAKLPNDMAEKIRMYTSHYVGGWRESDLNSISNAFVNWRYGYERKGTLGITTSFLKAFRNALREQCAKVVFGKTWDEYNEQRQLRIKR